MEYLHSLRHDVVNDLHAYSTQDKVFTVGSYIALAAWLPLFIIPYSSVTRKAVNISTFLNAIAYVYLLGSAASEYGGVMKLAGSFRTFAGLNALWGFGVKTTATINAFWFHYLSMDMQYGLIIARDAQLRGYNPRYIVPHLVLALMCTPASFVTWNLTTTIFG